MPNKIDLKGVEVGFKPIGPGKFRAMLDSHADKPDGKGQPGHNVVWEVVEGEHQGHKVYDYYSLQPKALWSIKGMLTALGVDPDELEGEVNLDDILDAMKGEEVVLVLKRPREGKWDDVQAVQPIDEWGS